jgi:Cd(II)/Pb(II)-responsive transcriptional regulator
MENHLKIGDLAERTGCLVETIHYYERKGLLPEPARSKGNYRLYNDEHAEQLRFIRHCRSLDMTLDEIRVLLNFRNTPDENCSDVNTLLDKHIGHVADRIEELTRLEIQLQELRMKCQKTSSAKDCGILQELAAGDEAEVRNLGSHGGSCH